eukprot:CAMPEP_0194041672 /NCGR_PEP_ID=MMETSP0009_2-20130614/13545_1 /TAXON_ID=210454 /ORGANISM="Grammatophora oceanica, Strain CCMP 410" /LENGTH=131 /DNA_ID=CAMNT_0038685259 /DNA_START=385 /DNA_END=780 /DNA_ORIENTATION=+
MAISHSLLRWHASPEGRRLKRLNAKTFAHPDTTKPDSFSQPRHFNKKPGHLVLSRRGCRLEDIKVAIPQNYDGCVNAHQREEKPQQIDKTDEASNLRNGSSFVSSVEGKTQEVNYGAVTYLPVGSNSNAAN